MEVETLVVPARREEMDAVNAFLCEELDKCDCPMKARMQLELAVEELFVNIACYSGSEKAAIDIEAGPEAVTVRFTDWGTPFVPLARPDADTTLSAQERDIGGLGILLVKKTMDEVAYSRQGGKNILTIKKILPRRR